jgi:uncharacterized integral membrane protein
MSSPYYKRRRRSLVRNLWVYRRLVALAIVLGLILWFVLTNNERVTIAFPFRLGQFQSTTGLVILLSALVGSLATALSMTVVWAIRKARADRDRDHDRDEPTDRPAKPPIDDDLPPPGYAAKTGDGLNREGPWS